MSITDCAFAQFDHSLRYLLTEAMDTSHRLSGKLHAINGYDTCNTPLTF